MGRSSERRTRESEKEEERERKKERERESIGDVNAPREKIQFSEDSSSLPFLFGGLHTWEL